MVCETTDRNGSAVPDELSPWYGNRTGQTVPPVRLVPGKLSLRYACEGRIVGYEMEVYL